MKANRQVIGLPLTLVLLQMPSTAAGAGKPVCSPPEDPAISYKHAKFAPDADIRRQFRGFEVSFDSKDDDGELGTNLLRVPHWVAQEVRRWEPPEGDQANDDVWCLDTGKRPKWFTDDDLFASGVAPNDDSYRSSGFDRGHMAMKLLVERLGQEAAYCTHTVLNAIPQRARFNRRVWQELELLTGAWAQAYGKVWIIQGPVFYPGKALTWIGDEGERKVAVPDAAFKIVIREKTPEKGNPASEGPEILAFLYSQLGAGYFGQTRDYRHERFLTTVDEIEELTGLDFKLSPDPRVEKRIERQRALALWEPSSVDRKQRRLFLTGCRR